MREKILIVDDSRDSRKLIEAILKKFGFETATAADGPAALKISEEFEPDLILLDIVMPEMDGFTVCRELKKNPEFKDIPVIFLSAQAEPADMVKGLELGGADYIGKPADKGELLARVRSHLRIRNLTKEVMAANHELRQKQERIDSDLRAAAVIQRSLLPLQPPKADTLQFAWKFEPCELVGGDIFNVLRLDDDHLALYIVDVSGHGVPSAMVTVYVHQMLQPNFESIIKQKTDSPPYYKITSPAEVLHALDLEDPFERFERFFTIVYMVINRSTGAVRYSAAGHPPPVAVRTTGELAFLCEGGPIIGFGNRVPFEEGVFTLKKGDKILLYTDGILELENESGAFLGEDRFYAMIREKEKLPIDAMLDAFFSRLHGFHGKRAPKDDLSMIGVEFCGDENFKCRNPDVK